MEGLKDMKALRINYSSMGKQLDKQKFLILNSSHDVPKGSRRHDRSTTPDNTDQNNKNTSSILDMDKKAFRQLSSSFKSVTRAKKGFFRSFQTEKSYENHYYPRFEQVKKSNPVYSLNRAKLERTITDMPERKQLPVDQHTESFTICLKNPLIQKTEFLYNKSKSFLNISAFSTNNNDTSKEYDQSMSNILPEEFHQQFEKQGS